MSTKNLAQKSATFLDSVNASSTSLSKTDSKVSHKIGKLSEILFNDILKNLQALRDAELEEPQEFDVEKPELEQKKINAKVRLAETVKADFIHYKGLIENAIDKYKELLMLESIQKIQINKKRNMDDLIKQLEILAMPDLDLMKIFEYENPELAETLKNKSQGTLTDDEKLFTAKASQNRAAAAAAAADTKRQTTFSLPHKPTAQHPIIPSPEEHHQSLGTKLLSLDNQDSDTGGFKDRSKHKPQYLSQKDRKKN